MRRSAAAVAASLFLVGCTADPADENGQATPPQETSTTNGETTEPAPEQPTAGAGEGTVEPPGDQPGEPLGQPEWAAPPQDEIGAAVAIEPLVFEGDGAAVGLSQVLAHSTGVQLVLTTRQQEPEGDAGPGGGPLAEPGDDGAADGLTLTIHHPDGQSTSTRDGRGQPGEQPEGPTLNSEMSMGTPEAYDYYLWLWPFPEENEGALELVVDWPAYGIDGQSAQIDLQRLVEARGDVVELWTQGAS